MTSIPLEEYRLALRDAVCSVCLCFTPQEEHPARCRHETIGDCSLFSKLGEVVDTISKVHSGSIVPYVDELRHSVCAKCDHQNALGVCDIRDDRGPVPNWCVLDTYFNLIVGAIEEVREREPNSEK